MIFGKKGVSAVNEVFIDDEPVSDKDIVLGIDMGRSYFWAAIAVINDDRKSARFYKCRFACDADGAESTVQLVYKVANEHNISVGADKPVNYAIESTGSYHYFFTRYVQINHPYTFRCFVQNPALLEKSKEKTDARDAKDLARLIMFQQLTYYSPLDGAQEELRVSTRLRALQVKKRVSVLNSMDSRLRYYGIIVSNWKRSIWRSDNGRIFLRELAAGNRDVEHLGELLEMDEKERDKYLSSIYYVPDSFSGVIKQYVDMLDNTEDDITVSEKNVRSLVLSNYSREHDLLCTVPGFGTVTASVYIAEVGGFDIEKRFKSSGAVAKYVSACPTNRISGDKKVSFRSRYGNKHVFSALLQSANSVWKSSSELAYWARSLSRGNAGIGKVALVRRLAEFAYWVLVKQEPCDLGKYDFNTRHKKAKKQIKTLDRMADQVVLDTSDPASFEALTKVAAKISKKIGGQYRFAPAGSDMNVPISKFIPEEDLKAKRLYNILFLNNVTEVSQLFAIVWSGSIQDMRGIGPALHDTAVKLLTENGFVIDIFDKES